MKTIVPRASAVLCALVLGACGGGSSAPQAAAQGPKEKVQALEDSGAIPKLERGPTIEGVDANGNGVRDDIDQFIDRSYASEPQRKAARQLAKNLQKSMLVDKQDLTAVRKLSVEGSRATNCIFLRFDAANGSKDPAAVGHELEAITANTKPRLLAYLAFSKAMDGAVISLPEGDTCE
jgi:hypothetical protein